MNRIYILKSIATGFILLLPVGVLLGIGGYAYAICFGIMVLFFLAFNNFETKQKNNYKKIITALPVAILLYWLTTSHKIKDVKSSINDLEEVKLAIILSSVSILIATIATLLILKRTKGEKLYD